MTKLKTVMTNAWTIARNAAKRFGGKASQYMPEAMKKAWAQIKRLKALGLS